MLRSNGVHFKTRRPLKKSYESTFATFSNNQTAQEHLKTVKNIRLFERHVESLKTVCLYYNLNETSCLNFG